jgi:hypothetical protein
MKPDTLDGVLLPDFKMSVAMLAAWMIPPVRFMPEFLHA